MCIIELYPDVHQEEYLTMLLQCKEFIWNSLHWYCTSNERNVISAYTESEIEEYARQLTYGNPMLEIVSKSIIEITIRDFIDVRDNYVEGGELPRRIENATVLKMDNPLTYKVDGDELWLQGLEAMASDGIRMADKVTIRGVIKEINIVKEEHQWFLEIIKEENNV